MKTLLLMAGAVIAGIGSLLTTSLHDRVLYDEDFIKRKPSPEFKWRQASPAGTGSYQEEWKPGTWPMGFNPLVGPDDKMWMIGQKLSWSLFCKRIACSHRLKASGRILTPGFPFVPDISIKTRIVV